MKRHHLILVFLFNFVCLTYGQSEEIDKLDKKIKSVFIKKPDSTKFFLKKKLRFSSQLSDSQKANAYNRLGVTYGQLILQDSADYYFNKALALTEENSTFRGKVYYNYGVCKRTFGNYPESFRLFEKANTLFIENDYQRGVAMVHTDKATNYNYLAEGEKAMAELKKAMVIFKKTKNTQDITFAQMELANLYANYEKHQFAIDLYKEFLPKLEKEKSINYYFTLVNYADVLLELNKLEEAENNYRKALKAFKSRENKNYYYFSLGKLAEISFRRGELQAAASLYKKAFNGLAALNSARLKQIAAIYLKTLNQLGRKQEALRVIKSIEQEEAHNKIELNAKNEVSFLRNAKETFKQNKLYQKALQASERLEFLKDSINKSENKLALEKAQASYQNKYQRNQNKILSKEKELLEEKQNKQAILILSMLVVFILGVFIVVILFKKNKQRLTLRQKAIRHLKNKEQALEDKRQAEKKLFEQQQESLEKKKREITSVSLEIANGENQLATILKNASSSEISPRVRTQIRNLMKKKNYWKFFNKKFVEVHPDFSRKLKNKFSHLTEKDVQFCILLKLKLTNKEIAQLLGINYESVISKKYRLRKKLNIQEEQVTLEEFLD